MTVRKPMLDSSGGSGGQITAGSGAFCPACGKSLIYGEAHFVPLVPDVLITDGCAEYMVSVTQWHLETYLSETGKQGIMWDVTCPCGYKAWTSFKPPQSWYDEFAKPGESLPENVFLQSGGVYGVLDASRIMADDKAAIREHLIAEYNKRKETEGDGFANVWFLDQCYRHGIVDAPYVYRDSIDSVATLCSHRLSLAQIGYCLWAMMTSENEHCWGADRNSVLGLFLQARNHVKDAEAVLAELIRFLGRADRSKANG